MSLSSSVVALATVSLMTTWSNSPAASSSVRAVTRRRSRSWASSVPRPTSLRTSVDQSPSQHLAAGDERVEVLIADEVIVHAVDLTGTRPTGGGRDRDEQVWMASAQLGDDSALTHRRGAGQNCEAGEHRGGRVCGSNVGHGHIMAYQDPPARPCA